ncbi:FH protein interacting protein FIP2 isoform X2 [Gastrolobium bilobum]|uniref:FH protein interacting protein FIP2 isoform X2 n=1 Tax=Gastrolobium bilobum TaxID=150636 RepID=UPI002AB0C2E7|nr:FH protein interacting protein FIP2 isoform X2 [Gastrolobium bilobum]
MKGFESDLCSVVRLNIGGKKFCTTTDTLTQREPDSMLAAMFSGRHTLCQDPDKGYVFVDRDGKHFRHILNWLRDGVVPTLEESEFGELLREAEFYQLLGLIDGIHAVLNKRKEDDELRTELTRTDIIKCIQSERVRFRGVNLSGIDLSKLDLYNVDFSYACLKNVFFSRANLQCAKFRDVDAEASIFHNATLREEDVNLLGQIFVVLYWLVHAFRVQIYKNADLTNANLEGAVLEGANLKGAKLTNANLRGANLQRAYLRHVNLRDTHLEGAKLDGANLLGAIR